VLLGLAGCSAAKLEKFARDNEQQQDAGVPSATGSPYTKTDILVPEAIIKGGQRELSGVAGTFSRLLVGQEDEIRFLNPVAIGGANNTLYIVDSGIPAEINNPVQGLNRSALPPQSEATVFLYNLLSKKIQSIENIGLQFKGDPGDIYVKTDGSFLLTDPAGKKVLYFDKKGGLLNTYSDPANLSRPIAVWADEMTQEVYVADGSYSHIVVFDQFGKAIKAIGGRGNGPGRFRAITAMTMGRDGLYVLDRLELPVQVLSKDGIFQYSFGELQQVFPTAIAVDENQLVFVSERSDNTIRVYENGQLIATVGGGGAAPGRFRLINSLWVYKGFLYVADGQNRRIQVLRINAPGSLGLPLGMQ
jgi:DNA-binding beta-propeller fold protein YncE